MKITKHTLDHIELITTGSTALFEINMVVAMHDWAGDQAEEGMDEMGALDWLINLLNLAAQGEDIKYGAQEFIKSTMTLNESRVHLCKVEQVGYNIDQIGEIK